MSVKITVGVLAFQGGFAEHMDHLRKAAAEIGEQQKGVEVAIVAVKSPRTELASVDGLILPGGESTTMGVFLAKDGATEALRDFIAANKPTWGTCAGLILLSNAVHGQQTGGQVTIGGLDVTTCRNWFGRQLQSFEGTVSLKNGVLGSTPEAKAVFIRAPSIMAINSPSIKTLATIATYPGKGEHGKDETVGKGSQDGEIVVAVEQNNLIGTTFHPELTSDVRWHEYFLRKVINQKLSNVK